MTITEDSARTNELASPAATRHWRRWLLRLIYLAIVLIVVAAVGFGGAGWYFSSQLLDVAPARLDYSLRVLALYGDVVQLTRTTDSMRSQVEGLVWPGGRAVLGAVVSVNRTSVLRDIHGSTRSLTPGMRVALDDHVYASPGSLHIPYRTVTFPDPLGPMPAWYVPGSRATWVIVVHGYTTDRAQGLPELPALTRLELPVLLISYRNDVGVPASPDHLYHLGATEWQDVEAAARFALAHGAHGVVLYGFSMGGTAVEEFLHHSKYAGRVRAVVLDAPVLDWNAVLDVAAAQRHLPGLLTLVAKRIVAWRLGLSSLDAINQVKMGADLRAPTLVFHGTGDTTVPISTSIAFARARPDLVTLVHIKGAEHTQSWNVAPTQYVTTLDSFLRRVLRVDDGSPHGPLPYGSSQPASNGVGIGDTDEQTSKF